MWRRVLRAVFGLDERSLGAFRIGLGLLLIADLANHAPWLGAFYTDRGLLPRSEVLTDLGGLWPPQVLSGGLALQVGLWSVGLIAATLFTVGWRARAAAAVSALVVLSFIQRNTIIVYAGDSLLYFCLLWSTFLPTDRRFSLAARGPRQAPRDPRVTSVGSAALALQVVFLYAITAVSKLQYPAWFDGYAVYAVLSKASLASHLGDWLRSFPRLLAVASVGAPLTEGFIAVLLAIPLWKGRARTAGVFVNAIFQLALWLCLQIGIFQAVALVAGLPFLPAAFWEQLGVGTVAGGPDAPAVGASRSRPRRVIAALPDALCAVLLAVMLLENSLSLPRSPVPLAGRVGRLLAHPAVIQRWRMFANVDVTPQGWWIAAGTLPDGRVVDLWTGRPLRYARPTLFIDTIRSHHWERAWVSLYPPKNSSLRRYLARYLCREWNHPRRPAERAGEIRLIYMREVALDPAVAPRVEPRLLLVSHCPARPD